MSYTTSLLSRTNQDGVSKANTAQILLTDRNSKEHPNNENNKKEPPQSNRYILVPSLKLKQTSELKVPENQQKNECQDRSYLIYS